MLDANAAQMGYLIAAELVPNLFFALHAGAWVDRRGRRRLIMIVADLGRGALIATIPLAYAFDALEIQQLYVVAFLVGTLTVLFHVVVQLALRLDRPAGELRRGELVRSPAAARSRSSPGRASGASSSSS